MIKSEILTEDKNDSYEGFVYQIVIEYDKDNELLSFIRKKGKLFYQIPKNVSEIGRIQIKLSKQDTLDFLKSWIKDIESICTLSYELYQTSENKPDDRLLSELVKITHTWKWNKHIQIKYHYNQNMAISLIGDHEKENLGQNKSKDIKIAPFKIPIGKYGNLFYLKKYSTIMKAVQNLIAFINSDD